MLQSTYPISIGDIAAELGIALPLSLGDSRVRALAGPAFASGPISVGDLLGKSAYTPMAGGIPNVDATAPGHPASFYTEKVPISIAVTGGVAPFSYAWSDVSGSGNVTAVSAVSTTVDFLVSYLAGPGAVYSQVVQCIVTDGTGATLTRTGTATLTLT